jgi:hypothetical protein
LYIRIGSIGEAGDVRDRHRATRLNNDADADASQDPEHGKGQKLLPHCNRADVFANTPVQIRSRLRDFGSLPGPSIIAPLVEARFCFGGLYFRRRHILRYLLSNLDPYSIGCIWSELFGANSNSVLSSNCLTIRRSIKVEPRPLLA